MILNFGPTFQLSRALQSTIARHNMQVSQEIDDRLFTASVPNLDLSTILFVVIVAAAFLLGV